MEYRSNSKVVVAADLCGICDVAICGRIIVCLRAEARMVGAPGSLDFWQGGPKNISLNNIPQPCSITSTASKEQTPCLEVFVLVRSHKFSSAGGQQFFSF